MYFSRHFRLVCVVFLLLLSFGSSAIVKISATTTAIDFGNWGGGTVSFTLDACIVSTDVSPSSTTLVPYDISAYNQDVLSTAADPYEMLDAAGTIPVGSGAQMTIVYTDLYGGVVDQQLTPNVFEPGNNPEEDGCPNTGGYNARFVFEITDTELYKLAAGVYTRTVRLHARGGKGGTQKKFLNVSIQITIGDLVQITQLTDVVFGPWSGVGDVQSDQVACVYRNGLTTYQLTPHGNVPGDPFQLTGPGIPLDYQVFWSDGGGFVEVTSGTPLLPLNNASGILDCNGSSNAQLRVLVTEVVLNTATVAGSYTGDLTLVIAPD